MSEVTNESVGSMLLSLFDGDRHFKETKMAVEDLESDLSGAVTTGCIVADVHFGGGIFPGRYYEVFGEEGAGKTTLVHMIEAWWQAQSPLHIVHRIETESAMDKARAQSIGVDMTRMIISETDIAEDGFDLIKSVTEKVMAKFGSEARVLHVWDTIGAASTRAEKNNGTNSGGMMEKPRIIKAALRTQTGFIAEHKSAVIFINQVMDADNWIGVQTPGGRGIRHHASQRIFIRKKGFIFHPNNDTLRIGNIAEVVMIKNKISMPDLSFRLKMLYQSGYQNIESLLEYVAENKEYTNGLLRTGGWYGLVLPDFLKTHTSRDDISLRFAQLLEWANGNPFIYRYMEWMAYYVYMNKYPLMELKYRLLFHEKTVNLIKAWNKCARKSTTIGGFENCTPVPESEFPIQPEKPTQEELRALNSQLDQMNRLLDLKEDDEELEVEA